MVSKETPSYFILFLLTVFSETRTKKWWYSRVSLEIRTWKPVVVFIETRVFLVEICLRQTPPKKTRFRWNHQGFKFLLQSNTWNHHFSVQVSLKPSTKKKERFPFKTTKTIYKKKETRSQKNAWFPFKTL